MKEQGNEKARELIQSVFEVKDRIWRGMEVNPDSGYELKESYREFDARHKFKLDKAVAAEEKDCISGDIMKGIKKPPDCPHFGKKCTPLNPLGAPMVSSEGACAAYYHYAFEPSDQ